MGPVIGITVSIDDSGKLRPGAEILYVRRSYAQAVRAAGGVPLLVPPDADPADVVRVCDGLVISGGADLPAAFGAGHPAVPGAEREARVAWDRRLLDCARERQRPLLGVCYGMQLLNLHRGGTLLEDIAARVPGALDHGGGGRASEHEVALAPGSRLFAALGASARVCSRHHQAVERVAPGLRAAATARDGVVEAIEPEDGEPLLGVEWHPEADATGKAVYGWLVQAAQPRAASRRRAKS
jgi:putative glutamine amidotransferase